MSINFTIALDNSTSASLRKINNTKPQLDAAMETGLDEVAADLLTAIPANMNWKNGTGQLAGSFTITSTPHVREVGSSLPYARRREFSFKGPDSLGRNFPNDPAAYYACAAVGQISETMFDRFDQHIDAALAP